jgi:L-amino acid N-acyltransferase YncA
MHESAGIVVATVGDALAAFFCLSTFEVNKDAPIVLAMRESMRSASLGQRPLDSYSFVVAGPICIDKQYRGTGLFERLYEFAASHFASRFDLAVAFIASENHRSLKAHEKVGMIPVAQFEYRDNAYDLVARRL